ncbi:hypothetical protein GJ496_003159, partial [Pomphorhynchus laevis]
AIELPGQPNDADTFKILLATDLHIGYMDNDPIRKDDSLNSLEEILQIANSNEVDFILMGGDLFHENKPSRHALNGCIVLLRRYCLGNSSSIAKTHNFEVVSDQSVNFESSPFHWANFEDPNLNVTMPIFTIHGNHDDPTGSGLLSPIDLLNSSGLLNYFGKVMSLDNIELTPLLLRKGITKLAIFGIGSVRDQRLHQLFTRRRVKALRPAKDVDEWFNIFVLHQNRSAHGPENFIPENCIPSFIDLVMWGHEHECRIDPEWNPIQRFYVTQPGSTIVTSLSEGEELPKHVAILHIWKKNFKMEKIELKTVRKLYLQTINIDDVLLQKLLREKSLEKYFVEKTQKILERAACDRIMNPKQPELPLVRIRSDLPLDVQTNSNNVACLTSVRFGQTFVGQVANPKSLLHFIRKKSHHSTSKLDTNAATIFHGNSDNSKVEDLVNLYFSNAENQHCLEMMSEKAFCDAVKYSADKDDREFISFFINFQLNNIQNKMKSAWSSLSEETINERIRRLKATNTDSLDIDMLERERCKMKAGQPFSVTNHQSDTVVTLLDVDDRDMLAIPADIATRSSTRGRRRGQASNRQVSARGRRGAKRNTAIQLNDPTQISEFITVEPAKNPKNNISCMKRCFSPELADFDSP